MLVLTRRSLRSAAGAGEDEESVLLIDTEKLIMFLREQGIAVAGLKPADLLAAIKSGIEPKLLTQLVRRCTTTVRVVSIRGGRSGLVRLGFDAPSTTLVTRSELLEELAAAFSASEMPIANLSRRPWFVAPLFGLALWILNGARLRLSGSEGTELAAG